MKRPLYNKVNREVLLDKIKSDNTDRTTLSFYQYANIGNPNIFRDHLYLILDEIGVTGRIYVSTEGVNGQISVPTENIDLLRSALDSVEFLAGCRLNKAIENMANHFLNLR